MKRLVLGVALVASILLCSSSGCGGGGGDSIAVHVTFFDISRTPTEDWLTQNTAVTITIDYQLNGGSVQSVPGKTFTGLVAAGNHQSMTGIFYAKANDLLTVTIMAENTSTGAWSPACNRTPSAVAIWTSDVFVAQSAPTLIDKQMGTPVSLQVPAACGTDVASGHILVTE